MRLSRFTEFSKKIICFGRNYKQHIDEMKHQTSNLPVLFIKPSSAYVTAGETIKIPKNCKDLHHEVELGIVINRKGSEIEENEAEDFIGGFVIALDMTARDFQTQAKKNGEPWTLAKAFDTSCPVGSFIPKEAILNYNSLNIWCKVNGNIKQQGNTSDMLFKVPKLISYISQYFTLEPGDLILTGTPHGVSQVKSGDSIEIGIDTLTKVDFKVI